MRLAPHGGFVACGNVFDSKTAALNHSANCPAGCG
jgi:hypothetical protein